MRLRWGTVLLACLFTALLVLAAGCSGKSPATPAVVTDPAADPGQAGAVVVLQAYAEARRMLNLRQAYEWLTPSSRAAFTADAFLAVYQGQQSFAYTSVTVDPPQDGQARGYLTGLTIIRDKSYKFARYPYTLRYEEGRWGVAQGAGLAPAALKAFDSGKFAESLQVADRWLAIDPFAWDPYLEQFYAYKETGRPAEAKAAWEKALELAPPEERPTLHDLLAMLYAKNKQGAELLETARKALDLAKELGPGHGERYDLQWRAGVVIDLALAYRLKGDERQALEYFEEARALDPRNADVERFERSISSK